MKKYKSRLFFCFFGFVILVCLTAFFNLKVTTKQGVDYQVKIIKIPLYLKILDFYDRHYNYKWLVNRIIEDAHSDSEKALTLFRWTCDNIRKVPEGFPVIDDHVWHIIIRGYGASDQMSDVFTALCNYAGMDASFASVGKRSIVLSFVKLDGKWSVFDPHRYSYFTDDNGNIASLYTLRSANWNIVCLRERPELDYAEIFHSLPEIKGIGLTRANIQSPFNRLRYQLEKWMGKIKEE